MINTSAAASSNKYGALDFKPVLKEYLLDTVEESEKDTLFYVRHSRRIAHLANNKSASDSPANVEMAEQLESAYEALTLKKDKQ